MPTIYRCTDSGLPAFTYNTSFTKNFENFAKILKACLVTGYGSKPAAGWALEDESTYYLVLKNASGKYVIFVDSKAQGATNSAYAGIYIDSVYQGMLNNAPVSGAVISGVGGNTNHLITLAYLYYGGASATDWTIVADGRTMIFTLSGNHSPSGYESDPHFALTLYTGDTADGNFIILGGELTNQLGVSYNMGKVSSFYTTGMEYNSGKVGSVLSGGTCSYSDVGSSPVRISLESLSMCSASVLTGKLSSRLRGVVHCPALYGLYLFAVRNSLLGTDIPYSSSVIADRHAPITLDDGHVVVPCSFFISNNPNILISASEYFW